MKRLITALCGILAALVLAGCSPDAAANPVHSASDLAGRRIAAVSGSEAAVWAGEIRDATILLFTDPGDAADAVRTGEADCALLTSSETEKGLKSSRLTALEEPYTDADYGIITALENPELTADVNAALGELTADGTLRKIVLSALAGGTDVYEQAETEASARAVLTLAVAADAYPYSYSAPDGTITGLDVFVARAVCDRLGLWLRVTGVDPKKIVESVQGGWADLGMGRFPVSGDLEEVGISEPYMHSTVRIIVRKK